MTNDEPPGVFRTVDNGAHWTDVTPPGEPGRPVGIATGFHTTGDQSAVLAVSIGSTDSANLFRTTDGGAHWSTSTVGVYDTQYFSFISAQRGWLEASRGAAMGSEPVDMLRTVDGGAQWEVMSRGASLDGQNPGTTGALDTGCDKTGIGFVDDSTGFATGVCAISAYYLRVTRDAGRTWQAQDLPLPPGITRAQVNAGLNWQAELSPPVFDGANGAGVVVSTLVTNSDTATHHDYVYFTHDAGARWELTDPPLRDATWARVVDANDWWAGDAGTLAHTTDAGAHWTTISNTGLDLEIAPGTDDLQFATPTRWLGPRRQWTRRAASHRHRGRGPYVATGRASEGPLTARASNSLNASGMTYRAAGLPTVHHRRSGAGCVLGVPNSPPTRTCTPRGRASTVTRPSRW